MYKIKSILFLIFFCLTNLQIIAQTGGWQIKPGEEFPIGGLNIQFDENAAFVPNEYFQVIENGGINLLFNDNKTQPERVNKIINGLNNYGGNLRLVLTMRDWPPNAIHVNFIDGVSIESQLNDYHSDKIYGYSVWDEPSDVGKLYDFWDSTFFNNNEFDDIKNLTDQIRKHPNSTGKLSFVNLYPMYWDSTNNDESRYKSYIDNYFSIMDSTKPELLCFDYYPFLNNGGFRSTFFQNLKIIRQKSMEYNVPFWFMLLSSKHLDYPDLTISQIRMQAYSALAYGAKGLIYYTYTLTPNWGGITYDSAILDKNFNIINPPDGHGPKYNDVAALNAEIKILGQTLLQLTPIVVYHNSDYPTPQSGINEELISNSNKVYNIVSSVTGTGNNYAMVGYLKHQTTNADYLFVVNKDYVSAHTFNLTLQSIAMNIYEISKVDGQQIIKETNTNVISSISLAPGEGRLFLIDDLTEEYVSGINDIERYKKDNIDKLFIAHNKGVVMINNKTGERKYFNDGGSYTQVVDIDIDTIKQRVYICQDNGTNGDFFAADLDLNVMFVYTDGGAFNRVTSVAYSESPNRIYIGQRFGIGGWVKIFNRDNFQYLSTWAPNKKINALHYLKNTNKLYIGHDTGILIYNVNNGTSGREVNTSYPVVDIEAINNASISPNNPIFVALDNGTTGGLNKYGGDLYNPSTLITGSRVLDISVNYPAADRLIAGVIRTNTNYYRNYSVLNTNSFLESYAVGLPKNSHYSDRLLLASNEGAYFYSFYVTITGPSEIYHPTKGQTPITYTWTSNTMQGTPPFTYRWYWDGVLVSTNSFYSRTLGYDGSYQPVNRALQLDVFDSANPILSATSTKILTEYCAGYNLAKKNNELLPEKFTLQQNYPNPFNPLTIIKYDLPADSRVQLKIYDILGKEVTELINEDKPAGYHEVEFNASNLASGVYLYRIQAGSFVDTKKMILLK